MSDITKPTVAAYGAKGRALAEGAIVAFGHDVATPEALADVALTAAGYDDAVAIVVALAHGTHTVTELFELADRWLTARRVS